MKAISIRQPWADLICAGIKDVENRTWKVNNLPMRVLIHSGSRRLKLTDEMMPLCWGLPIDNARIMDRFWNLDETPTSAIVGVATIDACIEDSPSVWADEGCYHWVMKDVQLFNEPILNVKGKLNLFDVPDIDENNLPEAREMPELKREGEHLVIPLNGSVFNMICDGEANTVQFNLTDDVCDFFVDKEGKELPTKTATLFCGDRKLECDVTEYEAYDMLDEEDKQPIIIDGPNGYERRWRRIDIVVAPRES